VISSSGRAEYSQAHWLGDEAAPRGFNRQDGLARLGVCRGLTSVRYYLVVRRNLAAVAVVCSMLWVVSGVSVIALTLHEHGHHVEAHHHRDAMQTVLHGHAHHGPPDHDHKLTASLRAPWASSGAHPHIVACQSRELPGRDAGSVRTATASLSRARDQGPPSYLMHCALLT